MNPITYFPVATQHQFTRNRELVRGKPYERYFSGDLWLHDDAMPALRAPMDRSKVVRPTPSELNSLLDPGYHAVENGFCELADGSAYVASLVPFPGCTGDMFRWWFWWHSVEPARYTLWYPHNHICANPVDRSVLTQPGLSHEQRYIGQTHRVDEYIGPDLLRIAITFVDPSELGFDTARFDDAGIVGHACARVALRRPPLSAATMVHLARRTVDGFELRSRYWIGHDASLQLFDRRVDLNPVATALGLKRALSGERVAYEQYLHDQIEFTHLSTFLAPLYEELGPTSATDQ